MSEKLCACCGEALLGRVDKKFCDDHCRSSFNNSQQVGMNQKLKEINHFLKKNRMILCKILEEQKVGSTQILNRKLQVRACRSVYRFGVVDVAVHSKSGDFGVRLEATPK
jgi:hypothetical protein